MIDRETGLVALRAENRERMRGNALAADQFVKMDGHWYFRQRKSMVDWFDFRHASATKPTTL
jgi:hypothetical protein